MRVAIIGGTRFIGPAVVEELLDRDHEVVVMHRGGRERADMPDVPHAHLDRADVAALSEALGSYRPAVVVDTVAYSAADANAAVAALPPTCRAVVLSSQDVYRAFYALRNGLPPTDDLPLTEDSPLRNDEQHYMFRGE